MGDVTPAETKNEQHIIEEVLDQLLSYIAIEASFKVAVSEDTAEVLLDTEDSGIVIGYHGETLESFAFVLSLCVAKRVGRYVRIRVDVGDYKKNREESLKALAQQTKERVLSEQREFSLPNLKSWERRVVHLLLQDDPEVTSESVGEGKERTLIVKPR